MADYTLTMADSDYSVDAVDGNTKIALDGSDLKLAPDEDVFGDTIANWLETQVTGTQSFVESSGIQYLPDPGNSDFQSLHCRDEITYEDGDVVFHFSDTKAAVKSYVGLMDVVLSRDNNTFATNAVLFRYLARQASGSQYLQVYKNINSSGTKLYEGHSSTYSELYFRIRRDAAGAGGGDNYFWFYTSTDGSSWIERYAGQIRDATYFSESHDLYALYGIYCEASAESFQPEMTHYYQYTGDIAAQRFWPDSPEATLVESGQTYAFDAGAGNIWSLTGASSTEDEDGGSINYKGGYSDDGSTITWVDAGWVSIATLNTNAGNGDYDGHRYLHFKTQYVSDGTQRPEITDFTVSGTAASNDHTISQSSTQAKEGTYSRKHVGPAVAQSDKHCLQYITTTEGERFYVSGWVYCTVAPTTGNFYVKLYDETGTALIEESQISATTSGWRKVAFYADAPASCVKMSLRVGGNVKGGTCYFDGASCKRLRVKDYS